MDPHLQSRLERVARLQGRSRLRLKLSACWAGAAAVGLLLLILFGQRTGGLPWSWLLALGAIASSAAGVIWLRHQRVAPNWRKLAAGIELNYPALNGRLLTAIQQEPRSAEKLNFLQERLVREALVHAQRHDWSEVVSRPRIVASGLLHALTLLCFLGALWAMRPGEVPETLSQGGKAGPEIMPGDVSVEKGDSLVIMARFAQERLPSGAELWIQPTNGPSRRVPLVRSLADPVFGTTLPDVESNFVYQVHYDGRQSRGFSVKVFEYPRLERSDAEITYPEYTGQGSRRIENTRRVTAVEQSKVGLVLQLNKPVATARFVPRGTNRGPAVVLATSSNAPVATLSEFALVTNRAYDLQLLDFEGRTNKVATQFVFEALPNREPELRLARPSGDVRPSPLEEVAFEGTAWDDFGIRAYGLGYTVAGSETRFLELGETVPAGEKRAFRHMLDLEDLRAEPDQLISWFVWAEDIGPDGNPRRTAGDLFFAEVRAFDEIFREGQSQDGGGEQGQPGQQGGQGSQSTQLAELQKKIMSATWRLQREQGTLKSFPAKDQSDEPGSKEQPAPRTSIRSSKAPTVWPRSFAAVGVPVFAQTRGTRAAENPASSKGELPKLSGRLEDDAAVIRDAQAQALSQAEQAREGQRDERAEALWRAASREMQRALTLLQQATNSAAPLGEALAAEQAAYQALLKLQEHEYRVSRARRQRGQQGSSSREQQMRMQLDQLDLTQSENRYETERQAQRQQSAERREQLQVMNRLEELARRQQDLNERLKELQTALQAATDEKQREEIRRQLKRLQEEQQTMVADADELQQRMQSPQNQKEMADERRQLEQTREELQRAAEAAEQGSVSQALASGTRAQRQLQEMREQMRRESSSQFAQDLQEMRAQARQLAREQEEILKQMKGEAQPEPGKLSLSSNQQELIDRFERQQQLLTNVVDRASEVSQEAESGEPLLSRQLYDTLRKFNQDSGQDLKETETELMRRGMMTRSLYERLQEPGKDGAKMLDLTGELLRMNFPEPAAQAGGRSRERIEELKRGVERAAGSVLGDDTEALRLAQKELDELTRQLQEEMAQAQGQGTGTNQAAAGDGRNRTAEQNSTQPGEPREALNQDSGSQPQGAQSEQAATQQSPPPSQSSPDQQASQQQASQQQNPNPQESQQASSDSQQNPSGQPGGQQAQNSPPDQPPTDQAREGQGGRPRQSLRDSQQTDAPRPEGSEAQTTQSGARSGGARRSGIDLDQLLRGPEGRGGSGPMLGEGFVDWSDRLRDVEEMVEMPELRNDIAGVRNRARNLRRDIKQDGKKPDWAQVTLQVVKPLVEVRNQIAEELARRNSSEALVPVDRDPVPNRYSDLVRRYYEALGKD